MDNPNCSRHGVAKMPNGSCYYCTLEGRAEEVQKTADQEATEEKENNDEVSA